MARAGHGDPIVLKEQASRPELAPAREAHKLLRPVQPDGFIAVLPAPSLLPIAPGERQRPGKRVRRQRDGVKNSSGLSPV
jgi:hypothetical protein